MNGLFITGTDTEIGKTMVTALLAFGLQRQGVDCVPIKSVASGAVDYEGRPTSEDALVYKQFCDLDEHPADLAPLAFRRPASPHFAAALEQRPISLPKLIASIRGIASPHACALIEGIGGWRVPLTEGYGVAELARSLGLPVLIVAANRLGAINHSLLTIESVRATGLPLAGVVFTHLNDEGEPDLLDDNIKTIAREGDCPILGRIPFLTPDRLEAGARDSLWETLQHCIEWNELNQWIRNQ